MVFYRALSRYRLILQGVRALKYKKESLYYKGKSTYVNVKI